MSRGDGGAGYSFNIPGGTRRNGVWGGLTVLSLRGGRHGGMVGLAAIFGIGKGKRRIGLGVISGSGGRDGMVGLAVIFTGGGRVGILLFPLLSTLGRGVGVAGLGV